LRKLVRVLGCLKGRKEKTFLPPQKKQHIKLTEGGVTPDHIVIISQVHCVGNGLAAKTYGRGGGTRTPSRRFWRPEFYISSPINVNSLIFRHGIFCHLVANTLNHIPYFSPTVFPLFIRQFANLCW